MAVHSYIAINHGNQLTISQIVEIPDHISILVLYGKRWSRHQGCWVSCSVSDSSVTWDGGVNMVNQVYGQLSTTHGHIPDCKLDSVVYAQWCMCMCVSYPCYHGYVQMWACLVWAERSTPDSFWVPSHRFNSATGEQKGITRSIYADSEPPSRMPNSLMPSAKLRSANLPFLRLWCDAVGDRTPASRIARGRSNHYATQGQSCSTSEIMLPFCSVMITPVLMWLVYAPIPWWRRTFTCYHGMPSVPTWILSKMCVISWACAFGDV